MSRDWSTPQGLAAIKEELAAGIEGWVPPAAYAVGLAPGPGGGAWFPHVNGPGGAHNLPGVVLATVLGHDGSTATIPLTEARLQAAVDALAPAQACTTVDHPNLAAWRRVLGALREEPGRAAYAVYVRDLHDPVTSDVDAALRRLLLGRPRA